MAASDRLSLVNPTKLWLWLATLMAMSFVIGGFLIAGTITDKNKDINQLKVDALIRNNQIFLESGNYRKFIEGIDSDFNSYSVKLTGVHNYRFGNFEENSICSSGFSDTAKTKVELCRPYKSFMPKILFYAGIFALALIAVFLLARRHDRLVFERLCSLLENYDVQINKHDNLSSILKKLREMRHREMDLLATTRTEQKMIRFIHNSRTNINIIMDFLKSVESNSHNQALLEVALACADRLDKQRGHIMMERKRSIDFVKIYRDVDLSALLVDFIDENKIIDPSCAITIIDETRTKNNLVVADKHVLREITQGLVSNAQQNSPGSDITIALAEDESSCFLTVSNKSDEAYDFNNHPPLNSPVLYGIETKRNGIGLFHAKQDVESWGGELAAISIENEFRIVITLKKFKPSIERKATLLPLV